MTGHCIDDGMGDAHATIDISEGSMGPVLLAVNNGMGQRFVGTGPTLVATTSSSATQVSSSSFIANAAGFANNFAGQVMAAVDFQNDFSSLSVSPPVCVYLFNGSGR